MAGAADDVAMGMAMLDGMRSGQQPLTPEPRDAGTAHGHVACTLTGGVADIPAAEGATAAAVAEAAPVRDPDVVDAKVIPAKRHSGSSTRRARLSLTAGSGISSLGLCAAGLVLGFGIGRMNHGIEPGPAIPLVDPTRDSSDPQQASLRAALVREREARLAAEGRAAGLLAELASEAMSRETSQSRAAEPVAKLAAAQEVPRDAMAADWPPPSTSARETVTAPLAPQPVLSPEPLVQPAPVVTPNAQPEAGTASSRSSGGGGNPDEGHQALASGRKLLMSGDLRGARDAFRRAAELGLPEGALALGTTYDPANLARLRLGASGDPDRAREWYRRAYEQVYDAPEQVGVR